MATLYTHAPAQAADELFLLQRATPKIRAVHASAAVQSGVPAELEKLIGGFQMVGVLPWQ